MVVKEQDEKSNNLRELLSSFYGSGSSDSESRFEPPDALQGIDLPNFDSDRYISSLIFTGSTYSYFSHVVLFSLCPEVL